MNASDIYSKESMNEVDGRTVLNKLDSVTIFTWNYIAEDPSIRHMGPMAQDFFAAYKLGEDERHIATIDSDGVALAAIKGLHDLVRQQAAELAGQRGELRELKEKLVGAVEENAKLLGRLEAIEKSLEQLKKAAPDRGGN